MFYPKLPSVAGAASHVSQAVDEALALTDECDELGFDGGCAVSALQRRAGRREEPTQPLVRLPAAGVLTRFLGICSQGLGATV